jgi:arylsulfatase A-like enzyme
MALLLAPVNRVKFITALLVFGAAVAHVGAATGTRPNIVFILTDDQRWDSLSLTGNTVVKTPNIDRLAAEGSYFPNGTITSAICTPSRVCYFLGQFERRHGVNFNSGTAISPAAWAKSYPVLLRDAGYYTGYVGKNHSPVGTHGYGSDLIQKSFDFWYAAHGHLGFYPKRRHPVFKDAKAETQVEILEEGALRFLAGRPGDKPFCLTVAFNLPHNGGTGSMEQLPTDPELYRTTYRDQLLTHPIPPTYLAKAAIRAPKLPPDVLVTQHRQKSYDYVDTEAALRERQIREYQSITGIDRFVGAVRHRLREIGAADNTIIFFASDHGITHGEFGLGGKALNYDTCLRVPMLVLDPRVAGKAKGQRSAALVQSVDFAPTMLDYAGIQIPATMQGKSFRAAVDGREFTGRRYAFAENLWSTFFGNPRIESARSAEWKYIRYFATDRTLFGASGGEAEGGAISDPIAAAYEKWRSASIRGEKPIYEELYRLSEDPHETKNLARDPAHATTLAELRQACQRLVTEAKGDVNARPATVRIQPQGGGKGKGGKNKK